MMLSLVLLYAGLTTSGCFSIEVTVSQGILSGLRLNSRNGSVYYAFLSIPYAKPPVGKLRFEPPQEPDSWDGVRDAKRDPPFCIQKDFYSANATDSSIIGEEDCLYLNVYTSKLTGKDLPVMVFIHGGCFYMGSGPTYGPDYIMDNDVILVTLNYRLGILGFLSSGDSVLPGNYGMKDQVAALRWVKKNIASFGGDPNNVMIFGQSAGGGSVSMHLYSPLSQGLFHKAISHSGTAMVPWMHFPRRVVASRMTATMVITGCYFPKSEDAVECLRSVPAKDLVEAYFKLFIWDYYPSMVFTVVTEPEGTEGAFLTKDPAPGGELNPNIPWITGVTSAESAYEIGYMMKNDGKLMKEFSSYYHRLFPVTFMYGFTADFKDIPVLTESLKKFYFGARDIGWETRRQLLELFSDSDFTFGTAKSVLGYKGRKYLYYFDYKAASSFNDLFLDSKKDVNDLGAAHCDELLLLFKVNYFPIDLNKLSQNDHEFSKLLVKLWVNFAYTGDPNTNGTRIWEPVGSDMKYLHISNEDMSMKNGFFREKYDFWSLLPLGTSRTSSQYRIQREL